MSNLTKLEDRLLVLQDQVDVLGKKYNPDQPRDDKGRWSDHEARMAQLNQEVNLIQTKHREHLQRVATRVATHLNFDPKKISVLDRVADKPNKFGGYTVGSYHPYKDKITLYSYVLGKEEAAGTIAHEIMHGKFGPVMAQYNKEKAAARVLANHAATDYENANWGVNSPFKKDDVTLKPQYYKQFPTLARLQKLYESKPSEMAKGSVSKYAGLFWDDYKKLGETSYNTAVNETLAEMASIDYETGRLPRRGGGWANDRWHELYYAVHALHTKLGG